jgi:hypothetical protein
MLRADYSRVDAHVLRVLYGGPATACSGPPGTDAAPPFETHLTAYGHCDAAAAHEPCGRSVGTPAVSSDDVVPSERRRAGVALAIFGPLVGAAVAAKPRDAARHRRCDAATAATTPKAATTADPSEETASAAAAGGEQRQRRRVRPSAEKRRRLKARAVLEAASDDGDVHF